MHGTVYKKVEVIYLCSDEEDMNDDTKMIVNIDRCNMTGKNDTSTSESEYRRFIITKCIGFQYIKICKKLQT